MATMITSMEHRKELFSSNDEFSDLNFVDQFIPLEECFVENLYPFNSAGFSNQVQDSYKVGQVIDLDGLDSFSIEFDKAKTIESYYPPKPIEFDFNQFSMLPADQSNEYYNLNIDSNVLKSSSESEDIYLINSSYSSNTECQQLNFADPLNKVLTNQGEKPPEPYANIIVKAILSTYNNAMQLKDIYNFMIENYEYFSSQKLSTKWKNSVRHNLSRHKYFIKTCEKNAQGHYWSIDEAYLSLFKSGNFDEKAIKKAKLNSRNCGKYKTSKFLANRMKKSKKQQKENKHISSSGGVFDTPLTSSTYLQAADSQMYSPTMSCKSYNSTQHNDSAYLSSSDFTNSSFNNEMANQQQQQQQQPQTDMRLFNHLQPNLSLFESLSEI